MKSPANRCSGAGQEERDMSNLAQGRLGPNINGHDIEENVDRLVAYLRALVDVDDDTRLGLAADRLLSSAIEAAEQVQKAVRDAFQGAQAKPPVVAAKVTRRRKTARKAVRR
jgi:hypothetical protein